MKHVEFCYYSQNFHSCHSQLIQLEYFHLFVVDQEGRERDPDLEWSHYSVSDDLSIFFRLWQSLD